MADLKELSEAMDRFVTAKGWYSPESPRPQTPKNIAVSLSLECAEVMEHFQWNEQPSDQMELAGELADVMLYLLQLARISGIDLEQAVFEKLEKNYLRSWDEDPGLNTES